MNAYAVSLSKYVNTGILALFTLLSYLGLMTRPGRMRRAIEIIQRILLAGFLINANMTIAWLAEGSASRMLLILCAMEILFMLSFMVLYRIVHEMANMMLFNNICMLLSIGFVTISRIAFYGNMEDIEYGSGEPIKQFVMASAGLLIMLVIPFFRRFFDSLRHMWIVFAVLGIAPLAAVLLLSRETNGAQITSTILGFTFQPSEFVKILFILMLAGILSGDVTKEKAVLATILSLIHVGILVRSTDLGSALIFFIVYLMVLFIATGKWSVIFGGFGLGAVGSVICYFLFYHVQVRVGIWRDPFSVIDGMGYQITQSLFAISYGGLWGAGLTQGTPTSIPNVETDFIFSAITEEMGLVFAVCLLLLCINCFIRILILSGSYSNRFFQLFTYGAAVCYIFQTFLTVGGETKFIPLTGVTLPLVSYGGSSVLSTLTMFGMIEMIFILHDERTARFKQRYDQEHSANAYADLPQGYSGYLQGDPAGYADVPGGYKGNSGGYNGSTGGDLKEYADISGGSSDHQGSYMDGLSDHEDDLSLYDDVPENFPVNGISEDGIFDS